MEKKTEHFIGLEWLRFLLGCYIMVYHSLHVYPQARSIPFLAEVASMGFFATSAFFVLSGFLLTHIYSRHGRMRESARRFWAKRLFNLYPIHIISLLAAIAVVALMQWLAIPPEGPVASPRFVIYDTNERLEPAARELLRHYMTDPEVFFNLLLQVFMLQAWNPYFLTFNAPLWSISTLFFFYLSFPLLAPRLVSVRSPGAIFLVLWAIYLLPAAWAVWHQLYGMPYTGLLQRNPLLRLPEFLAGVVSYALFRRYRTTALCQSPRWRAAAALCVLLSFAIPMLLITRTEGRHWYFLLHNGLLLPAQCLLIVLCALIRAPQNSRWLEHWSPRLGATSLSIFALHVPLFNLFRTLEQLLRGDPGLCLRDWQGCILAAGQVSLSIPGYLLYLTLTVFVCLLFQERVVATVRLWLTRRYL
ncbi:TPA: acyltransferase family protein [Raoultella planticola]